MNRKFYLPMATLAIIVLPPAAFSQQTQPQPATALTIYSTAQPGAIPPELYRPVVGVDTDRFAFRQIPGYAMVRQDRSVEIGKSRETIRFTDVAALIDPTTVTFTSLTDPDGTHVLDQNYQFDLVSTSKLMEKFIDKPVTVEQATGDKVTSITGTLLSTAGGIVLRDDKGAVQVLNNYTNVRFPELPGGLITRPTLVWDIATGKTGPHQTRVTYQTTGITWWADYNVIFTEGTDANSGVLDVGAWVSIINQSGASYQDAKLKLIAGDVHRAPTPPMAPMGGAMRRMAGAADMSEAGFQEKSFFEYHLYTLGRPASLPDNSTKQIELFPAARKVPCEKSMVYYGLEGFRWFAPDPAVDRNIGVQSNKKVDIYLRFKNKKDIGMGMPLPSGRIRVSKKDTADDSLEFIGEDTIDHTPRDEEVLIKMGSAFDVVGERRQVDFNVDTRAHRMTETIEVTLRNHKDAPVKVLVKENLYRWLNWEITQKSHSYEKIDSRTVHFPVEVAKDGEAKVTYTVVYTW